MAKRSIDAQGAVDLLSELGSGQDPIRYQGEWTTPESLISIFEANHPLGAHERRI